MRETPPVAPSVFNQAVKVSPVLASIIGADSCPRPEVMKRMFKYIMENGLKTGLQVRADEKLKPLFRGKDAVDMYQLTDIINENLQA